jgi:transcriptional regulator with XRE-family HTH domain
MVERLTLLMKTYELTASQLADAVGVQRSNISHLLAGRNNPSLDFVTRLLTKFPEVNADWLLFGKGSIHKKTGGAQTDLFSSSVIVPSETPSIPKPPEQPKIKNVQEIPAHEEVVEPPKTVKKPVREPNNQPIKTIKQIVVLYTDGSFDAYLPND